MRRAPVLVAALAATALLVGACGGDGEPAGGATSPTGTAEPGAVKIVDIAFEPSTITIQAGDTVTWTWEGSLQHSVTADDKSFDAGVQSKGATFQQTFDQPGTYEYYCSVHSTPDGTAQNGVVVVE